MRNTFQITKGKTKSADKQLNVMNFESANENRLLDLSSIITMNAVFFSFLIVEYVLKRRWHRKKQSQIYNVRRHNEMHINGAIKK